MQNEPIITADEHTDSEEMNFGVEERPSYLGIGIAIIIVFLSVIFIGLYMWSRLLVMQTTEPAPTATRPTAAENNEPESTTAEAKTEMMQVVSTSDELSAIEADLGATDLQDLDAELNAIDAELNATAQ